MFVHAYTDSDNKLNSLSYPVTFSWHRVDQQESAQIFDSRKIGGPDRDSNSRQALYRSSHRGYYSPEPKNLPEITSCDSIWTVIGVVSWSYSPELWSPSSNCGLTACKFYATQFQHSVSSMDDTEFETIYPVSQMASSSEDEELPQVKWMRFNVFVQFLYELFLQNFYYEFAALCLFCCFFIFCAVPIWLFFSSFLLLFLPFCC